MPRCPYQAATSSLVTIQGRGCPSPDDCDSCDCLRHPPSGACISGVAAWRGAIPICRSMQACHGCSGSAAMPVPSCVIPPGSGQSGVSGFRAPMAVRAVTACASDSGPGSVCMSSGATKGAVLACRSMQACRGCRGSAAMPLPTCVRPPGSAPSDCRAPMAVRAVTACANAPAAGGDGKGNLGTYMAIRSACAAGSIIRHGCCRRRRRR